MPVFSCDVCDPTDPCILPKAAPLAELPDACPWSKDGRVPVWRELKVVDR